MLCCDIFKRATLSFAPDAGRRAYSEIITFDNASAVQHEASQEQQESCGCILKAQAAENRLGSIAGNMRNAQRGTSTSQTKIRVWK